MDHPDQKTHEIKGVLVTQSFIVGKENTYHDYRDYIFAILSNPDLKNEPIRLNIENGEEYVTEFNDALRNADFKDYKVTAIKPSSWKDFMMTHLMETDAEWTMPFPGDHIYINPKPHAFSNALKKAGALNADAIAYGHVQDFDYYTDWDRAKVLYNDSEYVMIEWGDKYRFYQNPLLAKKTLETIHKKLVNPPIMGFLMYRKNFFKRILDAMPSGTKRWHDMEKSPVKAWTYKLLIPKAFLYRHVHGYWIEAHFKYEDSKIPFVNSKEEIESWYVPPRYDWKSNTPTPLEYMNMTLEAHPYYRRYHPDTLASVPNKYYKTPFDKDWKKPEGFSIALENFYKDFILDTLRWAKFYLIRMKIALKRSFEKKA